MKVFLHPNPEMQPADNGIGRVIHAQYKHLPQFGVQLIDEWQRAEVIAIHVEQFDFPRVDCLMVHGLYWTGDYGKGKYNSANHKLNENIVRSIRRARAVTVPSPWVATPFKRDMRFSPDVVPHGIDSDDWQPIAENKRGIFVLWNKNRAADVCDPTPAWILAEAGIPVVSTFGPDNKPPSEHLQVVGKLPGEQMRRAVEQADVYLATTHETFGVGTLEAMACGVPVLGYNWGGTANIVRHGVDGYLVAPYDTNGLIAGYEWIKANRAALSEAARERAKEFSWEAACMQYAQIYQRLLDNPTPAPGVAIVITSYNYGRYLGEAIESALNQTVFPAEVVVIDDGSTDNTREVAAHFSKRVGYIYQENSGVAEARNRGVRETTAPFIVCLDADDRLAPRYVEVVQDALATDPGRGIAYTGLGFIMPGGVSDNRWTGGFNWEWQAGADVPPHTTIPTAATFTRKLWQRVGGYRQVYAPGEDAEFYTRGLAAGFTAVKASEVPLVEYRNHGQGAHVTIPYSPIDGDKPWMRDQQYPFAAPALVMPEVRSYSEPIISVIMPVGPGHAVHLPRSIASVEGQTWRNWELVLVNDTGAPLDAALMEPYPYVRIIEMGPTRGTGAARNAGVRAATSPFVLFLDADDELMPDAMGSMLKAFTEHEGRYIYSTWGHWKDGELVIEGAPDYDAVHSISTLLHAVTVLMARVDALSVPFDETLALLEDYDFFARCAIAGIHGFKLEDPMVIVDVQSGLRTRANMDKRLEVTNAIRERYKAYIEGGKMPKSCCGGGGEAVLAAKERLTIWETGQSTPAPAGAISGPGEVRMEFTGVEKGAQSFFGSNGRVYRAGNNALERYINVHPDDVQIMLMKPNFRVVPQPATVAQPSPERPMEPTHFSAFPEPVAIGRPSPFEAEMKSGPEPTNPDPMASVGRQGRVTPPPPPGARRAATPSPLPVPVPVQPKPQPAPAQPLGPEGFPVWPPVNPNQPPAPVAAARVEVPPDETLFPGEHTAIADSGPISTPPWERGL